LNIQCRVKLSNLLWTLKNELSKNKAMTALLATTLESVAANQDTNIFFIDQMTRAYLLYCKLSLNE
jgi:hypothetical protein